MNERDSSSPGALFWLAFAVALALRLVALDLRPLHHDEALNAWFIRELVEGAGYRYNPNAYHGPFPILLGGLVARLLGYGTSALRLPVALASALMIPLLLPLRRRLGRGGITLAAWLLAVSPSLVYYGRDLFHETYLIAATLALVVAASLWLERGQRRHLCLASGCAALLFTIKETAILSLAGLVVAALAAWGPRRALSRARAEIRASRRRDLAFAGAVFVTVWIAGFTIFFTHPEGLVGSFRAYLPWLSKGIGGAQHGKPWTYFPRLLWSFEAPIVLGALLFLPLALRRKVTASAGGGEGVEDRFALFCALWALAELLLYSAIPYKTPWLMINVVVPAALSAGGLLRTLSASRGSDRERGPSAEPQPAAWVSRAFLAVLFLSLGWSAWRACDACFRRYDDPAIGLVYSDTSRAVWNLLAFVRETEERCGHPALVSYQPSRWPLRWYLRGLPETEWRKRVEGPPAAPLVLADQGQREALRPYFHAGDRFRSFALRPNLTIDVWVRGGAGCLGYPRGEM